MRDVETVMMSSAQQDRERLESLGDALQTVIPVPTDTYITEDIPLLLTKLSRIPAAPEPPEPTR